MFQALVQQLVHGNLQNLVSTPGGAHTLPTPCLLQQACQPPIYSQLKTLPMPARARPWSHAAMQPCAHTLPLHSVRHSLPCSSSRPMYFSGSSGSTTSAATCLRKRFASAATVLEGASPRSAACRSRPTSYTVSQPAGQPAAVSRMDGITFWQSNPACPRSLSQVGLRSPPLQPPTRVDHTMLRTEQCVRKIGRAHV